MPSKTSEASNVAVIMAGGAGERFWPLTSLRLPKYAIDITKGTSFLKETYNRLHPIVGKKNVYVITADEHKTLITQLIPGIKNSNILSEPYRRNTAGAVSYATYHLSKVYSPSVNIAFFPADADIHNLGAFSSAVKKAYRCAHKEDSVVVLGIKPDRPSTGYGYIESRAVRSGESAVPVKNFIEKPDLKKAKQLIRKKNMYWNAGIFVWRADVFKKLMTRHNPVYTSKFEKAFKRTVTGQSLKKLFKSLPKEPIDKLLAEKISEIFVVPGRFRWDDIGTWDALRRMRGDQRGNIADNFAVGEGVSGCVLKSTEDVRGVAQGVKDIIVILNDGKLLVTSGEQADAVKNAKLLWEKAK